MAGMDEHQNKSGSLLESGPRVAMRVGYIRIFLHLGTLFVPWLQPNISATWS